MSEHSARGEKKNEGRSERMKGERIKTAIEINRYGIENLRKLLPYIK
jgi:hypothetical protein